MHAQNNFCIDLLLNSERGAGECVRVSVCTSSVFVCRNNILVYRMQFPLNMPILMQFGVYGVSVHWAGMVCVSADGSCFVFIWMSGSLGEHYASFSAFKDYVHGGDKTIRQTRKYVFD